MYHCRLAQQKGVSGEVGRSQVIGDTWSIQGFQLRCDLPSERIKYFAAILYTTELRYLITVRQARVS
ncbi:hypothetical protein Pmani_027697 [Petrolisthes manimaculis]|uniref:Uncharacterized protein n=1 Tax=Petrolisthes manimaculis TaxID=1843537 RepID=A0AAE1P2G2_9EUCA|nr:hypothetical protein Pmani_027697 [Petrolisthes manimaculis]